MVNQSVFSDNEKELLNRVKSTILALEPTAEVFLFGSRARGDANVESDWDVLILVEGNVSEQRKWTIQDALCEIQVNNGVVIGAVVQSKERWYQSALYQATPFYQSAGQHLISV